MQGGKGRTSVLLKYRSTEKYPEVPRSAEKYQEVPRSTEKYQEVQRSTKKYERSTLFFLDVYLNIEQKCLIIGKNKISVPKNRAKVFCFWEFPKTRQNFCSHKQNTFVLF